MVKKNLLTDFTKKFKIYPFVFLFLCLCFGFFIFKKILLVIIGGAKMGFPPILIFWGTGCPGCPQSLRLCLRGCLIYLSHIKCIGYIKVKVLLMSADVEL